MISFDAGRFGPLLCALALVAGALPGCSPTFDWREVRIDGAALTGLYPCKPDRRTRTVPVDGQPVRMEMVVCSAGGSTFATTFVDIADPAAVAPAVAALRAAAVVNVGGAAPRWQPFDLAGATPNPQAARLRVSGRLPDGQAVEEHAAFFVRGLRVYTASVVGPAPDAEAVESFVGALKLAS